MTKAFPFSYLVQMAEASRSEANSRSIECCEKSLMGHMDYD